MSRKKKQKAKTFRAYEKATQHHLICSRISKKMAYLLFIQNSLAEEVGEISGVLKRILRDHGGKLTATAKEKLAGECGDVLWTLTRLVNASGFSLEEIARTNIKKIKDRVKRKKIRGSGDDR